MNLSDVIAHHADRNPERLALSMGDAELTYAQLAGRVEHTAGALCAEGVGRETVVGVLLQNCSSSSRSCSRARTSARSSCRSTGGSRRAELAYIIDHAGAAVLVSEAELAGGLASCTRTADLHARG